MTRTRRRILLVSKFRTFQGGVEKHIEDLTAGLLKRGFEVSFFGSEDVTEAGGNVFTKDAYGSRKRASAAKSLLWNRDARRLLEQKISDFGPDLVHYHSVYHQLSPSVLGLFKGPNVMTLHDYKLAAPCYTLYRDGDVCIDCVGKTLALPSLRHGCVGKSLAQGALCVAESVLFRRTYLQNIRRFIVPSVFIKKIMTQAGIPEEQLTVIPWGVSTGTQGAQYDPAYSRPLVVFAGRLHPSKGIVPILEAWTHARLGTFATLVIAGSGELAEVVEASAMRDQSIDYLGMLAPAKASELISQADLVLMPSLFPETMGLTAVEALVRGIPIATSGRGALGDLAGVGVVEFPSMEVAAVAKTLLGLLENPVQLRTLRTELKKRDLSKYTLEAMTERVLAEYSNAGLELD